MIINHNIAALNTHRQMGSAQSAQMNSMEKLSSGLRINSAKDDAAGLTISEKMRGQIRGLEQASTNAQDGISLIQTAEGAMSETQDILQRMRELAVQSSNGTNTDQDREEIQKEVNELSKEITRISENTEFNTMNLLGKEGKGFEGKFHIGANMGQNIDLQINDMGAKALGVNGVTAGATVTLDTDIALNNLTAEGYTIKYTALGDKDAAAVTETTAVVNKEDKEITVTLKQVAGTGTVAGAVEANLKDVAKVLSDTGLTTAEVAVGKEATIATVPGADVSLTAGTVDPTKGINVSSQETASTAIKTINNAIETVSSERSKLGATQNRLEHTINNLNTSSENLTSAESRIRDVDYAKAA